MRPCWLELTVLPAREGENGFPLLHSSVIDTSYKKVEGSGELIISLCTHTIGRQSGNPAGRGMSGCHKGDSDTLLRSVSSEIQREGQANLIFLCVQTIGCATLGGESHSIARQMQLTLPPIGGSELVVVFKGFRREYIL